MGVVSRLMSQVRSADLPRRRVYLGQLALLVLAVTAVVAARLSSPRLLSTGWEGNTETPYGILMICLALVSGLVPEGKRMGGGRRFLLAVGVAVLTGTLGYQFLPVGGYDLYAKVDLYGYALLGGLGYLVAGVLTSADSSNRTTWWGFAWAGGIALAVLSMVFFAARSGAVTPGPAAGEWKGSLRSRVLLCSPTQTAQVTNDLLADSLKASGGVVDIGPGPSGQPPTRLVATDNSGVELMVGQQTVWRLRAPLWLSSPDGLSYGPENALLWAKWTDAGGVVFAVNGLDWRSPRWRGADPNYQAVTVFQVGP